MNVETYQKFAALFRKNSRLMKALLLSSHILTCTGVIAYLFLLIICTYQSQYRYLMKSILIPGIGFVLITLTRKLINAPRPYEAFDIKPLIKRDKKGCSFPSRHVYSMSVIAASWFGICVSSASVLLICAVMLSIIRVVSAIHYPRDVIAGFMIGTLLGVLTSLL